MRSFPLFSLVLVNAFPWNHHLCQWLEESHNLLSFSPDLELQVYPKCHAGCPSYVWQQAVRYIETQTFLLFLDCLQFESFFCLFPVSCSTLLSYPWPSNGLHFMVYVSKMFRRLPFSWYRLSSSLLIEESWGAPAFHPSPSSPSPIAHRLVTRICLPGLSEFPSP